MIYEVNLDELKKCGSVDELQEKESKLAYTVAKSFYTGEIDYSKMKLAERDVTSVEFQKRDEFHSKQQEQERTEKWGKSFFRKMIK